MFECGFECEQFAAQQVDFSLCFVNTLSKLIDTAQKLLDGGGEPNDRCRFHVICLLRHLYRSASLHFWVKGEIHASACSEGALRRPGSWHQISALRVPTNSFEATSQVV